MVRLVLALTALVLSPIASAQDPMSDAMRGSRMHLRVAYDCQTRGCDHAFFQTELPYVQFVRDQGDADVFVLIAGEGTGGGGRRYSLFIEDRGVSAQTSTLTVSVRADATADDERRALASRLALGLAPFVAQTRAADRVAITYDAPTLEEGTAAEEPQTDPWNGWNFRVSTRGAVQGESASSAFNGNGRLSAGRVTDRWKTRASVFGDYRRNAYDSFTGDGADTTVVSARSSYGGSGLVGRSLSRRVSIGTELSVSSSTYSNYRSRAVLGSGVEVSLYPYTEATRRLVTATYSVGVESAVYGEQTIYGKLREVLPQHSFHVNAELAQPWGSASMSLTGQQYLAQLDKYEVELGGGVNVRLARGLELNVGGSASIIENQLSLSAGGLTPEEILTQQQQQATSFRYAGNVGISYAFGSIFNSVVNPRFGDRGVIIVG